MIFTADIRAGISLWQFFNGYLEVFNGFHHILTDLWADGEGGLDLCCMGGEGCKVCGVTIGTPGTPVATPGDVEPESGDVADAVAAELPDVVVVGWWYGLKYG